jgi:hypothetical protein
MPCNVEELPILCSITNKDQQSPTPRLVVHSLDPATGEAKGGGCIQTSKLLGCSLPKLADPRGRGCGVHVASRCLSVS